MEATMKLHKLILIILILGLMLVACTDGTETVEEPKPEEPGEAAPEREEYPAPESTPTTELITILYPDIEDGGEINWSQAFGLVMNGEVVKIVQTQDLKVSLTLRDGRTFFMFQPELGAILKVVESCGDLCSEIIVETE
jgi:hypothetical protein